MSLVLVKEGVVAEEPRDVGRGGGRDKALATRRVQKGRRRLARRPLHRVVEVVDHGRAQAQLASRRDLARGHGSAAVDGRVLASDDRQRKHRVRRPPCTERGRLHRGRRGRRKGLGHVRSERGQRRNFLALHLACFPAIVAVAGIAGALGPTVAVVAVLFSLGRRGCGFYYRDKERKKLFTYECFQAYLASGHLEGNAAQGWPRPLGTAWATSA